MSRRSGSTEVGVVTLVAPRRRIVVLLAGALAFAAIAVWMVRDGALVGWFALGFFGLCALVFLIQLVTPGRLVISPTTIEFSNTGRRWTFDLARCGPFEVWRGPVGKQSLVVFNHPEPTNRRLARVNGKLAGHNSSIPETYGLSAVELAELLNDARDKVRFDDRRLGPPRTKR